MTQGTLEEITINNRWNPLRRHIKRSGLFTDMEGEALGVELAQSFTDYLGHLLIDSNAFLIDLTHVMNYNGPQNSDR